MHDSENGFREQINQIVDQWNRAGSCPFSQLVTEETVNSVCNECGLKFRDRVYSPCVTTWTFIAQVISRDHSCRDAISRLRAWRVSEGMPGISLDSSSYCEARQRLPVAFFERLLHQTASDVERLEYPEWTLLGRRLRAVDGTTVTMPDTPKNQAEFPQSTGQQPGVGFPIARVVMICNISTGAMCDVAIGATKGKKTGESTLFRTIASRCLQKGDVLVGDREFESFRGIAHCLDLGVDVIFRMNASRRSDFRRGKKLGRYDHIVVWNKPKFDSSRYTREEYDQMPDELVMREIRIRVEDERLRPKTVTIVTTLLDPKYKAAEIAKAMRRRWRIETNLNACKTHMQMAHLRTRHPETVRKEILTHLIAYNLICNVVAHAAIIHGLEPTEISHKGTLQVIDAHAHRLSHVDHFTIREMLKAIASQRVGQRPNREEPRKRKKRKSKYTYMTKPRDQERQQLKC